MADKLSRIPSLWSNKHREERRRLLAAHRIAFKVAQEVYDRYRDQAVVMSHGDGPGYSFLSAASPSREAWDAYFDSMQEQGFSAWDTQTRFNREFDRWSK